MAKKSVAVFVPLPSFKKSMEFWTQVLDVASTTAHRVGAQLLLDFGHVQGLEKADGSLVTQSDEWADREIRSSIAIHRWRM